MSAPFLPYGRHTIEDDDIAAVVAALRSDYLTTGPLVGRFEQALAAWLNVPHVVACNSGTAALHLALAAQGIGPGMRVVVPAITFVATANAARFVGADVVFADVDPDNGLMYAAHVDAAVRAAPAAAHAMLPVHLNGQSAELPALAAMAAQHGLQVVSDCCHALGTTYAEDGGGVLGDGRYEQAAAFSFHAVKTMTMGEGGAVATASEELATRARRLRGHGIVRNAEDFLEPAMARDADGEIRPWYYEMQELGCNFRATDFQCALAIAQLSKLARFTARRRALAARYDRMLAPLAPHVRPLKRVPGCTPAWHLYAVLIEFSQLTIGRAALMRELHTRGIGTQVHYIPVYRQPYYRSLYGEQSLPGAEVYYARELSLPLFPAMDDADVDRVVHELSALVTRFAC